MHCHFCYCNRYGLLWLVFFYGIKILIHYCLISIKILDAINKVRFYLLITEKNSDIRNVLSKQNQCRYLFSCVHGEIYFQIVIIQMTQL